MGGMPRRMVVRFSQFAYEYSRAGNPTRTVFETCVASLEAAKYGKDSVVQWYRYI